jgi:uncharacterized damage-inducible protein DinB
VFAGEIVVSSAEYTHRMLPYNSKDLAAAFRTVRKNTLQIAEDIPEDHYSFTPAPGTRSVAQLLTHIAITDRFQRTVHGEKRTTLQGVNFATYLNELHLEERTPRSKAEILALLKNNGETFAAYLESLGDDFLGERVEMPQGAQPSSKTRFEMLMGVKEHEMHHRGQLMLIERMLGLTPHLTRQMQERFAARAS